jgi:hypothetical protein
MRAIVFLNFQGRWIPLFDSLLEIGQRFVGYSQTSNGSNSKGVVPHDSPDIAMETPGYDTDQASHAGK